MSDFKYQIAVAVLLCITALNAPAALRPIASNIFLMGARECSGAPFEADEQPVHDVMLGDFLVDDAEVTISQFCMMLNQRPEWFQQAAATEDGSSNACYGVVRFAGVGTPPVAWLTRIAQVITNNAGVWQPAVSARSTHPMVNVTWHGAALYCNYLSERDGFVPLYHTTNWSCNWVGAGDTNSGYHLPTEAQWERAASAGSVEAYPWGRFLDYSRANLYASGDAAESDDVAKWPATMPVRSYVSNAFGLYDMIGNVREWCNDWYQPGYYATLPFICPKGPDDPSPQFAGGTNRVIRGGGWAYEPEPVSVSSRAGASPVTGAMDLGFRVSRYANALPEPGGIVSVLLLCSLSRTARRR